MFCIWDFDVCDSGLKIENCSVLCPEAPQTGQRPARSTWLRAKIPDVTLLPLLLAGESADSATQSQLFLCICLMA